MSIDKTYGVALFSNPIHSTAILEGKSKELLIEMLPNNIYRRFRLKAHYNTNVVA